MQGAIGRPGGRRAAARPQAAPRGLLEVGPPGPGRDVGHTALRIAPLVVVAVTVQVEDVLAVGCSEPVQDALQQRVARVVPRRIGGPVPEGHDEGDRGIALRRVHERRGPGIPVGPSPAVGLGVADEADIAVIEPVPVLAGAARRGRSRGGLGIGQAEAAFVVPEVVRLRGFPFVVAPGRHVGRVLGPDHHVVEVPVHGGLAVLAPVGEVADQQGEVRPGGRDVRLHRGHAGIADARPDVALDQHGELGRAAGRRSLEGVIGPASDRVVVGRVLLEAGNGRLPVRTGR